MTWATPDAPLVEVGGVTANLIGSLSDPKAWMEHLEPSQTIYSWAMNNHWHTNYRAEQDGPTVFRYIIWPHSSGQKEDAWGFGLEMSQPVIVAAARGGKRDNSPRVLVRSSDVLVSALKPSEDGKGLIVRLFGASGKASKAEFTWSEPKPTALWLSDNSEKPGAKTGDTVEVPAYGVVTVRAEFGAP